MSKNILIIGGTRFFGRLLVELLLAEGCRVTIATRGQQKDAFGDRVARIQVDRRDGAAMSNAFAAAQYDLIYDQVCYSPLDAKIASDVFAGKVKRYVMTSTIEVYADLGDERGMPLSEDCIDLSNEPIELPERWRDFAQVEAQYGLAKRQAEDYFHQRGDLSVAIARVGHVMAESGDFTGRLKRHIARVEQGGASAHKAGRGRSSFISAANVAIALCWLGEQSCLGALNIADEAPFSANSLERRIALVAGIELNVSAGASASDDMPFNYLHDFVMDLSRLRQLGYVPGNTDDWLDGVIRTQRSSMACVHGKG